MKCRATYPVSSPQKSQGRIHYLGMPAIAAMDSVNLSQTKVGRGHFQEILQAKPRVLGIH